MDKKKFLELFKECLEDGSIEIKRDIDMFCCSDDIKIYVKGELVKEIDLT